MYKLTALLITVLLIGFSATLAQDARSIVQPRIAITGDEISEPSQNTDVFTADPVSFGQVNSGSLVWTVNNITDRQTGYDLQSNGSTQQVWADINNPGYVHAVFTNSQQTAAWTDRTCLYFGTTDGGANWFELGGVPVNNGTTGRSGFPAIIGTSDGRAVISNHNNADQTATRATVFIDNSFFEYSFTNYDPGATSGGEAIWPRLTALANDDLVLAASVNGGTGFAVNTWSGGVFAGWQAHQGDQAETYSLAVSEGQKVGLAYLGETAGVDNRDVFYKGSTDGGLTWSNPVKIWDADETQTEFQGGLRSLNVNFYGEDPCVVFEIGWLTATGYFPGREAEVRFWSPLINEGVSKVIADSNSVPYYPNYGVADVQFPIGRPVIGRSQKHDYLFVAFLATTGDYWPGSGSADSTAYFSGWFMQSTDGGENWTAPEKFTPYPPEAPLRDFRYVSIAPVNPVQPVPDDDIITVHIVMQGDTIPGSNVNGMVPALVSAQYYHFTTEILVVVPSNDDEIIANNFNLEQNYPNPFNPSTTINYSLAERSDVSLKVYDVLGNEIATLVNTSQEAGQHNVTFDASKLSSGLYIYTLNTGNFTSSKKMMLLK